QLLAQGVYEQAIVAGQGLVEGHLPSGWTEQMAAGGLHFGRGVFGHEAAKIRNYHAVVVAEQRAQVVGERHFFRVTHNSKLKTHNSKGVGCAADNVDTLARIVQVALVAAVGEVICLCKDAEFWGNAVITPQAEVDNGIGLTRRFGALKAIDGITQAI
nr:hypothetical protein [Tanacetum cinerariifolium]